MWIVLFLLFWPVLLVIHLVKSGWELGEIAVDKTAKAAKWMEKNIQ